MDIIEPNGIADFEWAIRLNRIMMNFVGIWPSANKNSYDKFLSNVHAIFSLLVIVFVGLVPLIQSFLKTWGDLISMIDNLQFILTFIMCIVKLLIIWWKKADLLIIINMIAGDWIKTKTEKERYIMVKQAQNARILTTFGLFIMFLLMTVTLTLPFFGITIQMHGTNITKLDNILPLQTHYNYDKQSPYFEFTYVAQAFLALICAAVYSGVDNLLGLLIFHFCGQLENLKEKLINIKGFNTYNEGMAFIVTEHIRLIKCFNVIENIFTLLLLGLLIFFGTVFCFYGFIMLTILTEGKKISIIRIIFFIFVLVNIIAHMCLFCALGEILITKCEAIYYAACEYKWYELKPQKAKTLLLIMMRAKEPLYIMAGNMFPMTMSMFCNLIKTSAGYISVLFAMQSNK